MGKIISALCTFFYFIFNDIGHAVLIGVPVIWFVRMLKFVFDS